MFEVLWKSGNRSWIPYLEVRNLEAFDRYLELQGVQRIEALPEGKIISENIPDEMLAAYAKPHKRQRKNRRRNNSKNTPSPPVSQSFKNSSRRRVEFLP